VADRSAVPLRIEASRLLGGRGVALPVRSKRVSIRTARPGVRSVAMSAVVVIPPIAVIGINTACLVRRPGRDGGPTGAVADASSDVVTVWMTVVPTRRRAAMTDGKGARVGLHRSFGRSPEVLSVAMACSPGARATASDVALGVELCLCVCREYGGGSGSA
jgi:hypothetical protein